MDHLEEQKKKIHPKEKANVLSTILFLYALKLFKKGFKKDLEVTDLYDVLPDYRSKKLGDRLEDQWENQKAGRQNLSVSRLLWTCYGPSYILLGCVQVFNDIVLGITVQSYVLGKLILYFADGQDQLTKRDAYLYAATLICVLWTRILIGSHYALMLSGYGIKIRTAFVSFIYRKILKLSPTRLADISSGKILSLITKDVHTLEMFATLGNELWIGILRIIVSSSLLYLKLGVASLAGVGCFLILMPLQISIGKRVTSFKMKMNKKTDERLQIVQEIVSSIRLIRMYTWDKFFARRVSHSRRKEMQAAYQMFIMQFITLIVGTVNSQIALYIMLMSYIWLGNSITSELVYFVFVIFMNVSLTVSVMFPMALSQAAQLVPTVKRIGAILKKIEIQTEEPPIGRSGVKVSLDDVTVSIGEKPVLQKCNLDLGKGLTILTGPVGSGKTILLKTVLQEYEPVEGKLTVQGDVSYASQEPWLFPSSIKQNILFGQKYDEARYRNVLKICALVYDLDHLECGDSTIVEDRGSNLSRGQQARINLARAIYKDSDIYLLDDCLAGLDGHVSSSIFENCIKTFLKEKLVILVTHNDNYVKEADVRIFLKSGTVESGEKFERLDKQELRSERYETEEDLDENDQVVDESSKLIPETVTRRRVYQEDKKSGEVVARVYKKYFSSGGGFIGVMSVLLVHVLVQFVLSWKEKFLSDWVILEEQISNYTATNSTTSPESDIFHHKKIFYTYTCLTAAIILTHLGTASSIVLFARKASIKLHEKMTASILSASMVFFDTNFVGNILNRFSKDLTTVDEMIPFTFHNLLTLVLSLTGIMILIASVNTLFLIPLTLFLMTIVVTRNYCIGTTRSLKRLDALTRSPVVGHMNATLEGLTTIRAFKAEAILRDEFDRHQDLYTSTSYCLQTSMKALILILNTFTVLFNATIVLRFLIFDFDTPSGYVGLALSQAYMISMTLNGVIRRWTELENQMTSVERVLEYVDVEKENRQGFELEDWPTKGEIVYENVYLLYPNTNEYVLKNIHFTVKSGEKIGIVGRTGAGKSSIISALFRLYEVEGKISIDDVDTKTLSSDSLRTKISIIPQDPVIFSGTIRDNIDPSRKYTDEEIWKVIQKTNLKKSIWSLDTEIAVGTCNFSVGQKQLLCLARAVIQQNKIVVLDEATANMDADTEAIIRQTVEENFASCTVLTVAHRISSIMKSDRIFVLDKGEIIECDKPETLLENKDGAFYKMVEKAKLLEGSTL